MTEEQARAAFIAHMLTYTAKLVRNAAKFPVDSGIGSGFMISRGDDILLITAGHLFRRSGAWSLETNVLGPKGTLHLYLAKLQLLSTVDLATGKDDDVDLAWAAIPRSSAKAALADLEDKSQVVEFPVYKGPLDCEVKADEYYGFAAHTQPVFDQNRLELERSPCVELDLTLSDRNSENGVVTFNLSRKHKGQLYYKGASGAPIADPEGRIVAVLLAGDPDANVLFAMELQRYSPLFQPAA